MRCSKARKAIIRHIDGEIRHPENENALLSHLDKCHKCNTALNRLKSVSLAVANLRRPAAAATFRLRKDDSAQTPASIQDNVHSFIYQQAMIPPPLVPSYVPRLAAVAVTAVLIVFIGLNLLWQPIRLPFIDVIGDVAYLDKAAGRWEVIQDFMSLRAPKGGEAISSQSHPKGFSLQSQQIVLTKHKSVLIVDMDSLGKLTAAPNSMFWFKDLRRNRLTNARKIKIALRRGTLFIRKDRLPAGSLFLVETPSLTARAVGTSFLVTTTDDSNSRVTVQEGTVKVTAPKLHRGSVTLKERESIAAKDFKEKDPGPTEASERELMKIKRFSGGGQSSIRTDDPLDKYRVTDYLDDVGYNGNWSNDWSDSHKIEFQFEKKGERK